MPCTVLAVWFNSHRILYHNLVTIRLPQGTALSSFPQTPVLVAVIVEEMKAGTGVPLKTLGKLTTECVRLLCNGGASPAGNPRGLLFLATHGRGRGALICAFKNPGKYRCVCICSNSQSVLCPWGNKAFSGYLGTDQSKWEACDATHLVKSYSDFQLDILTDQGKDDQFLSDG